MMYEIQYNHALPCSCCLCAYKSGLVCSLSFMYDNGVQYTQIAVL